MLLLQIIIEIKTNNTRIQQRKKLSQNNEILLNTILLSYITNPTQLYKYFSFLHSET